MEGDCVKVRPVAIGGWAVGPEIMRGILGGEEMVLVDVNEMAPLLVDGSGGLMPDWRRRASEFLHDGCAAREGCVIMGWSTGALVAASVARQIGSSRTVLLSAAGSAPEEGGAWPRRVLSRMRSRLREDTRKVVGEFASLCRDDRDGRVEESWFGDRYTAGALLAGLDFLEHYRYDPASDRSAGPVIAFHGRGDRVAPVESGRIFGAVVGARFVELEGGHMFFTNPRNAEIIRGSM